MKNISKQTYLVGTTLVVLILLVVIQVNWIIKAARLEEQNFSHRVAIALNGARDGIFKSMKKCADMQDFLCGKKCSYTVRQEKIEQIDSILKTNLEACKIELDYTFGINEGRRYKKTRIFGIKYYLQSINGLLEENDIQLSLHFPHRNQFLMAQLSGIFIISILLIVFVMISFLIMLRLYRKERNLSEHIRDFINNMVHEFQTPLSNIGFASGLIRKKSDNQQSHKLDEYTQIILNEKNKIQRHVEEILQVACLEGEHKPVNERVDTHQLLDELIVRFRPRVEKSGGEIITSLDAVNCQVVGNRSHLYNALSNLLDNALKYNMKAPVIKLTSLCEKSRLTLTIEDNGIGISKKDLPYIFDKYYRVSTGDVHNIKGFGLGLTYVKRVIEQQNGTISVTSKEGVGTRFVITLPVANE